MSCRHDEYEFISKEGYKLMRSIVTVVGKDQVGIIAGVCTQLAQENVNVLDINQTILNGNFTMVMLVDTALSKAPFADLAAAMEEFGRGRGLSIHMQREDIFNAMHRI